MCMCVGEKGEGRKGRYVKKKESVHTKTGSSTNVSEAEQTMFCTHVENILLSVFKLLDKFRKHTRVVSITGGQSRKLQ